METATVIECPACGADMKRCKGDSQMPASQNFQKCPTCGLSGHLATLTIVEGRRKLKKNYIRKLKNEIAMGKIAQELLAIIKG